MIALDQIAGALDRAACDAAAIPQWSGDQALSVDTAYAVQARLVAARHARGYRQIGIKMGFTSRAKMRQMGVSEMIWGRLTEDMRIDDGGEIELSRYVHPRIEPEVAFLLKSNLAGRVSGAEALAAVEAVAPAMEIIDSRYESFKFNLADVIADNASSSGFVVGGWRPKDLPLGHLGVILEVDGRVRQIGSTADILGHPLRSLVAAAALIGAAGETLRPGDIVMAGGVTAAEPLTPGTSVRAVIEQLGQVTIRAVQGV
jgi:2-oxo-3-hexenedioate decarboxylase